MEFNATFLISALSFIVFVFIMNAIFYQPVIKIMEERKAFIDKNEQDTEKANINSEKISEQKQSELAKARAEAKVSVDDGSEKFKTENKVILENFSKEQKDRTEAEKNKLNDEAKIAQNELNQSSEDFSKIITSKILGAENV
ncbi:MAG: hypothetical protein ACI37T_07620 [Candidatus Gastranaerophilaceae bacterium]